MSCQPVIIATGARTSGTRASNRRSAQYVASGSTSRSHSWKNGTGAPTATRSAVSSGTVASPRTSLG